MDKINVKIPKPPSGLNSDILVYDTQASTFFGAKSHVSKDKNGTDAGGPKPINIIDVTCSVCSFLVFYDANIFGSIKTPGSNRSIYFSCFDL
jgi:hypothetical protein